MNQPTVELINDHDEVAAVVRVAIEDETFGILTDDLTDRIARSIAARLLGSTPAPTPDGPELFVTLNEALDMGLGENHGHDTEAVIEAFLHLNNRSTKGSVSRTALLETLTTETPTTPKPDPPRPVSEDQLHQPTNPQNAAGLLNRAGYVYQDGSAITGPLIGEQLRNDLIDPAPSTPGQGGTIAVIPATLIAGGLVRPRTDGDA